MGRLYKLKQQKNKYRMTNDIERLPPYFEMPPLWFKWREILAYCILKKTLHLFHRYTRDVRIFSSVKVSY